MNALKVEEAPLSPRRMIRRTQPGGSSDRGADAQPWVLADPPPSPLSTTNGHFAQCQIDAHDESQQKAAWHG